MRPRLAVLFVLLALLGAGACTQQDAGDDTDTAAETEDLGEDEFRLVGTVIEAKHRAEPPGGLPDEVAPETEEDEEADADTEDDTGVGGMAIRPENDDDAEGLDDCEATQDAYVTYYVEDTTWDPEDVFDDEDFPVGLAGRTVDVEGRIFTAEAEDEDEEGDVDATDDPEASPEDEDAEESPEAEEDDAAEAEGCILVLDEVEVTEDEETDTDTDTDDGIAPGAGGTEGDDGSPAPTGEADETTVPGSPAPTADFPDEPFFGEGASPDPCEGRKACAEKEAEGELPE